jgi:protein gp37
MAEQSAISWTDATFNPWIGCTRVSPGCDHCYAARDNERRKWVSAWGAERRRTKTWGDPVKWNRKAAETGYRPRVFCASLADVFDNEVPHEWRDDLFDLIRATPNLRWMLLTKRIGNARKMLPHDFSPATFPHVGIMATMVNQPEWDRDLHKLVDINAAWRGVSAEPLLGLIDIGKITSADIAWIITGGESGPQHRFTAQAWVRAMRDQCAERGIAFHHKQWGGNRPKENGCLIDGVEHKHFPAALAAYK